MPQYTAKPDTTEHKLRKTFNVNMIREHIVLISDYIISMEAAGKTDVFNMEIELLEVFPEFYDQYPFLVKKLCKKDDITVLYKMLDNLEQVEKGDKTMATVEDNLGKELANQYLYPNINKKK
jgi:hypothetical protein